MALFQLFDKDIQRALGHLLTFLLELGPLLQQPMDSFVQLGYHDVLVPVLLPQADSIGVGPGRTWRSTCKLLICLNLPQHVIDPAKNLVLIAVVVTVVVHRGSSHLLLLLD